MHIDMPYQSLKTIFQTTYYPRLKIWNLLNQLKSKWSFLGDHEHPHQIIQNVNFYFLFFLGQIAKTYVNIFMCMANYKQSQFHFFKHIPCN